MSEIVYLRTDPVMDGLVKIGRTANLEDRVRSLTVHSGVPAPFEVFYSCRVNDTNRVEKNLHDHRGLPTSGDLPQSLLEVL
jgi:hypothetical protein